MNYITERDVEVKLINKLFQNTLLYPDKCLNWNYPVKMNFGREKKTKFADLVITHDKHKKPLIVVEAKKPTETLQSGISQVDSYAFFLESRYSIVTNGKSFLLRGYYDNKKVNIIESDIQSLEKNDWSQVKKLISYFEVLNSINLKPNSPIIIDYEKIKDYRRYFRNIHNLIRDGDKLDPGASFDEFSKILCLKFYQEEWILKNGTNPLTLEKINEFNLTNQGVDFVNNWFQKSIEESYHEIFEKKTKINLSFDTLYSVLDKLENFKLKGDIDIKGRAFEEFLPTQLRGKGLGQFFTPRPIVNFMAELAEISIYDIIGDFACGSGGFLIKAFEHMIDLTNQLPDGMWARIGANKEEFIEAIKLNQIFGIDAEPRAARTAKINMMMWGDGKRVVRGNSLDTKDDEGNDYLLKEYDIEDKKSGCTVILANPPFGSKEKKETILKNYILGSKNHSRNSQKTEILFLEKGIKLLKPEGKMLIIIPSGILSNDSYKYVRDYLHSEAEIRAVIDLPTHTFVQSGVPTIKTSILYLQKFTTDKKKKYDDLFNRNTENISYELKQNKDFDYPVFMGNAEYIGFEPNGRIINNSELTDLDLLLEDFKKQSELINQPIDLVNFSSKYYQDKDSNRIDNSNIRGTNKDLKNSFKINFSELEDRLDVNYYFFKNNSGELLKKFEPLGEKIKDKSKRFLPKNDDELDIEYRVLSVTNNEGVIFNEFRKGEEFTSSYKIVKKGNIAYNPYRVNVGSIGIVSEELDKSFVSPAYVVFDIDGIDSEFFIQLIKSPFYKMYIDIITTGSIRDNLSLDLLRTLKFPKVNKSEQSEILKEVLSLNITQRNLKNEMYVNKQNIMNKLHSLISE